MGEKERDMTEAGPTRLFTHMCDMTKCIHFVPPGPYGCNYMGTIKIGDKAAKCMCYEPNHEKHREELRAQMEARYPGYRERLKEE